MHRFRLGFMLVVMASVGARADQFCFARAETFYEQVYCQLQAKAQAKNLPSFAQFRKNSEQVQALLLKRPAERNAIKLPMPSAPKPVNTEPLKSSVEIHKVAAKSLSLEPGQLFQPTSSIGAGGSACELRGKELYCGTGIFVLRGNQANQRLVKEALSAGHAMEIPAYSGGNLREYLAGAYLQYISKMCEIGLCGATMTYGKFAYLYQDIKAKGLDFSQRFETMFGFLKKDKATMGLSEAIALPQGVVVDDCNPLEDNHYICEKQGRNFIFVRQ